MRTIYAKKSNRNHGFHTDIESATLQNANYRRVLFTTKNSQLVLMSLKPGEEIGSEIHDLDQFFRFESGRGKVIINDKEYTVKDGDAVIIPEGSKHNIINTSKSEQLKLYSIYSPPQHKKGTINKNKSDEKEEHFDGKTDLV